MGSSQKSPLPHFPSRTVEVVKKLSLKTQRSFYHAKLSGSSAEITLVVGESACNAAVEMSLRKGHEPSSPNIAHLLGHTSYDGKQAAILEPVDMTVRALLDKEKHSMNNRERLVLLRSAAYGLLQIHSSEDPRILRNVSADNLFVRLSSNFVDVVYGDFLHILRPDVASTEMCGYVLHCAPEVCALHPSVKAPAEFPRTYSFASDVWSFGILIVEVLQSGKEFRFAGTYERLSEMFYEKRQTPEIPASAEQVYPELAHLARRCMAFQIEDRPNIADVLAALERMQPPRDDPGAAHFPTASAVPSSSIDPEDAFRILTVGSAF